IASFWGLLWLFVVIRGIDGYVQAFGAPGMVKINAAWFRSNERGGFAGIFGFMINLGRFGINNLGAALLAGFVFLGLLRIPPLHWRWLFWIPAGIALVIGTCMALIVKDTPEEVGFRPVNPEEETGGHVQVKVFDVFKIIVTNPVVWIVACAYACTGAVRQGIDQWFPLFMRQVHHVDYRSAQFQILAASIPFVASAGSLISGVVSDKVFNGRRAPVAAVLYFLETFIILAAAQFHSVNAAIVFLVLISLTANSTHSILGAAAAIFGMPRSKVSDVHPDRRAGNSPGTSTRSARKKYLRRSGVCANANRRACRHLESPALAPALSLSAPENVPQASARIMAPQPMAAGARHGRRIGRPLSRRRRRSREFRDR